MNTLVSNTLFFCFVILFIVTHEIAFSEVSFSEAEIYLFIFRCIQLAAIFMKGIEYAILANDACGSPVPWEFCCPWNFFDGKLFHSKWLQSTMKVNTTDLCEGKVCMLFRYLIRLGK